MIIVFYNKDADVCVYEYELINGVFICVKKDLFYNNTEKKKFYEITGVTNDYLAYVITRIHKRLEDNRVIIFENNNQTSIYDMPDMINTLFIYRKQITVLQASITEDDVKQIVEWLAEHM